MVASTVNITKGTVPKLVCVALHIDPVIKLGPPKIYKPCDHYKGTIPATHLGLAAVLIYAGLFLTLMGLV